MGNRIKDAIDEAMEETRDTCAAKRVRDEKGTRPKLWVVYGRTESCDEFMYVIESERKPSAKQIVRFLRKRLPDEYEAFGDVGFRLLQVVPERLEP